MSMALPGSWLDPGIGISRTYVCDNIRNIAYSNTSGFCNEKVDELFKKGAVEPDFAKRKALYNEVQKLVWEEAPMIWVVQLAPPLIYNAKLINPPLTGWAQYGPFEDIYWRGGSK
jgi:peptide/nickel transport system substrate-binding protein